MARTYEGIHERPPVFGLVDGRPIKVNYPAGASETYANNSGKWMTRDANQGRVTLALTASTELMGWGMVGPISTNATDEVTKIDIDVALETLYEMPIDAAQTGAALLDLMWETCDIVCAGVTSVQYADLDASATDVLQLIDFRVYESASSANNTVVVRRTLSKIGASGVA